MKNLKIGTKVKYAYPMPAISCQMNGLMVTGTGKIVGKNQDADGLNYEVQRYPGEITRMRRSEIRAI